MSQARRATGERLRILLAAFERLGEAQRLETAAKELEATLAGNLMTEAALTELENLERAVGSARATFEGGATRLVLELTPEGVSAVTVDSRPVAAAILQLVEPTRIEVRGVGAFVISPPAGAGASSQARLEAARGPTLHPPCCGSASPTC